MKNQNLFDFKLEEFYTIDLYVIFVMDYVELGLIVSIFLDSS